MDGAQSMFLEGIIISLVCRDEVVCFFFFTVGGKKKKKNLNKSTSYKN